MRAAIYNSYGAPSVVKVAQVEKPEIKANEVLVRIHVTTVTSGDARLRALDFPPIFKLPARLMFGFRRPKKQILGHEFAGVVEATGTAVKNFEAGDRVFGTTTMLPGGAHAEYVSIPESWKFGVIEKMSDGLDFKEAAALPIGAMTALNLLEKAKVSSAKQILIYGASGSVGSYAIQIAKHKGLKVTAVCSAKNFDMVKDLGADDCLDYKTENYTDLDPAFDIVFDAVGKTSKSEAGRILGQGGAFVSVKMLTQEKQEYISQIREMAEQGALRAFVDKSFDLEEIEAAHSYVDSGRKRGNILVEVLKSNVNNL
jgi:NADPH:quinone reductase-like Zn-dependent oxidoreductase